MDIGVLSYNIWFRDVKIEERTDSLIATILNHNPDIVCLQEVRPDVWDHLCKTFNNMYFFCVPETIRGYGVAILSKYKIIEHLSFPFLKSRMGRELLIVKLELSDGKHIIVGNAHYESEFKITEENTEKINQYKKSYELLNLLSESTNNIIFCSDTNILEHEELMFFPKEWKDSWIICNSPVDSQYTYDTCKNPFLEHLKKVYRSRLDRILYRGDQLNLKYFELIKGIDGLCCPSDHFGVFSFFKLNS
jgi:exonuclease III